MDPWIAAAADEIAERAPAELEQLVAVSSPSGDHADDLIVTLEGTGSGRIVLLGHVDTVHAHDVHVPLARDGDNLIGAGTVDMKGGDVIAVGVLRALAQRRDDFEE